MLRRFWKERIFFLWLLATNMKFLVDANLGRKFTNLINKAWYDAVFINDLLAKTSDEEVLTLAERENRIIITNDKDFGELIFKLGKSSAGIILLRTSITDPEKRFEMVKNALDKAECKFIVVKEGQIRMRNLKWAMFDSCLIFKCCLIFLFFIFIFIFFFLCSVVNSPYIGRIFVQQLSNLFVAQFFHIFQIRN